MEQFPAFVLVSCLRMKDKSEEDQARAARLFDLSLHARLLQVEYPPPALPYQRSNIGRGTCWGLKWPSFGDSLTPSTRRFPGVLLWQVEETEKCAARTTTTTTTKKHLALPHGPYTRVRLAFGLRPRNSFLVFERLCNLLFQRILLLFSIAHHQLPRGYALYVCTIPENNY